MPDVPAPRGALLKKLGEAGWPLVSDRVVRGICHDLNGRVNTLTSLSYLMDSGSGGWAKVGSTVQEELAALEELSHLLRTLPDDQSGPELLSLAEVVHRLGALLRLQPGLEGIQLELDLSPEAPAMRVDRVLLTRCLLLLLTGAAEEARARGTLAVQVREVPDGTRLHIGPVRKSGSGADGSGINFGSDRVPEGMEGLVGEVLEGLGGGLTVKGREEDGATLELRWPDRGG